MTSGPALTQLAAPRPASWRPRLLHFAFLALAARDEGPVRRRVFALVAVHAGLHQRDIARRLEMRPSHAEYHLHQLERAGLLRVEASGRYRRYFATVDSAPVSDDAVAPADRPLVALLREARPLEIVAHLIAQSPLPLGALAERMGLATSTLSYHVDKLQAHGVVERRREGNQRLVALLDRDRVVRVLLQHEPPDDLVAGFEELWDDIGL